ncbi:protein of unknown function [Cupriavidus taiwanensis]|nr:protein of unknown function [Cupriavidus taiwanensis]
MNIRRPAKARINSVKTLPRLSLDFVDISHTVYPIAAPKFEREVRAETSGRVEIRGKNANDIRRHEMPAATPKLRRSATVYSSALSRVNGQSIQGARNE